MAFGSFTFGCLGTLLFRVELSCDVHLDHLDAKFLAALAMELEARGRNQTAANGT